jgi:hypothetical protein
MLTKEDQRDKIRSQLFYELGLPETPKIVKDKSTVGLSKRDRFLKNPNNLKPKGEKPL